MHFTHALPRPARNERGEGKSNKTKLLSPTLSSSFAGREGEDRFPSQMLISLIQRQWGQGEGVPISYCINKAKFRSS